jgi:crotonobetainyl-CoA:carnitine CoA-transferase CaiB-like acyl-CoA transferase
LRVVNPRLIYAALTGYGSDGPHALLAGHDVNYLAMSGVLDLNRDANGVPVIPGVQIADLAGGSMQAVIGILLAMEARRRTGIGQRVDVSMTDGLGVLLPVARSGGPVELLSGRYACYRVYAAAEGSFVAVGALEPKFWANLCRELGCEDLIELQFDSSAIRPLEKILLNLTAEEWFQRIGSRDCCVTPVRKAAPAATPAGRAPLLGEHNGEFL